MAIRERRARRINYDFKERIFIHELAESKLLNLSESIHIHSRGIPSLPEVFRIDGLLFGLRELRISNFVLGL